MPFAFSHSSIRSSTSFPILTILWSPHALWALALVYLGYVHLPSIIGAKGPRTAYVAGAIFLLCLPLYTFYALYFCQITMVHGDEGQYLRVTQSLVHDGDMDLANNLSIEQIKEFHVSNFGLNETPAAPEGKVYSKHPIGLSIALVPAYWWSLEAWANPRLGTALFIALLASLCVPLLFLYLTRLGAEPWSALAATGMMAITGPFFYYSNQIYPEIPAVVIALVVLLALVHWQTPGRGYRSLGRGETPLLGLLTLMICCLPFLHPRYGPMGFLCGALVLLQAWHSRRRWLCLGLIGLVVASGLCGILTYHYTYSNDWLGPLRPGSGPWSEEPLDVATLGVSLPGHWLEGRGGILNMSPIYFFALFGLLTLAKLRDRRVIIVALLYAVTAGIYGLHTLWSVGYDFPGRFLVTALPALAIGLAWGLPPLLRRPTTSFLVAVALVISLDSVLLTLMLPETGYKGNNLLGRSIARFYPFQMHFFGREQQDLPLLDLTFWGVLAAAVFFRPKRFGLRTAVVTFVAITPLLWYQTDAAITRIKTSRSPYMPLLSDKIEPFRLEYDVPLEPVGENSADPEGRLRARSGHTPAGMIGYSRMFMPLVGVPHRGIYLLKFPGLQVDAPHGEISGYLTLSRRYTVPAVSRWSTRSNYPLIGGLVPGDQSLIFDIDRPRFCYVHTFYTGTGDLALDGIRARLIPVRTLPEPQLTEIDRVVHETNERPIRAVHRFRDLPEGPLPRPLQSSRARRLNAFSSATPRLSKPPSIHSRHRRVPWCWVRTRPGGCPFPSPATRPPSLRFVLDRDQGRSRAAAIRRWRRPGTDRNRPLPGDLRPPLIVNPGRIHPPSNGHIVEPALPATNGGRPIVADVLCRDCVHPRNMAHGKHKSLTTERSLRRIIP